MTWPMVQLGSLVRKISTWNPTTSPENIEFLYIDLSSVDKDQKKINATDVNNISAAMAPSRARQLVKENDVLVSTVRPNLNGVALVTADFDGATASTGYCVLRADKKKIDERYLFYWVQSVHFIRDMISKATGANYPAVSDKIIFDSKIPLPPLEEQRRIAEILDKADAIRQKRQQAIALADQFLRSAFIDMFGGDISSENNVVSLGDVVTLDAPMVDPREEMYADLLHIGPDRIEKNTGRLLPALTAKEEGLISKKFLFNDEYVLYSKIRPYLKKAAISNFTGLCSADMYPVKPIDGKTTKEFIWMLLLSDLFDSYIKSLAERANIPKLNRKELAAFRFTLPDFKKIESFTNIVKKTAELKNNTQSSCANLEKIFDSLSRKAFAGQL